MVPEVLTLWRFINQFINIIIITMRAMFPHVEAFDNQVIDFQPISILCNGREKLQPLRQLKILAYV